MTGFDVPVLTGSPRRTAPWTVRRAEGAELEAYRRLRRTGFVDEQHLFAGSDRDDVDDDPRAVVLVAVATETGAVVGGVRLAPLTERDIGWWAGSRLVVDGTVRGTAGLGARLVEEACLVAEASGVLRFDAAVQDRYAGLFTRLGWTDHGPASIAGAPHRRMRWPIDRIRALAERTKAPLAALLDPFGAAWGSAAAASLGGQGFVGDDGAPVPGSDLVAACDAILPAMVQRDPEWAGWCGVLVNVNDLAAMGAAPVGLLDAVAGPDLATVQRVIRGLRSAAEAWDVPVLGGHTQLGVAASLAVTALGRAAQPVPGGGGRRHDALSLTADLSGGWRPGAQGVQWDSTSSRSGEELRVMGRMVRDAVPRAAKDVSMAGVVGTAGMLAEAAGLGADIEVAAVPAPADAATGDWLTCFPGFGMLTADAPGASRMGSPLTTTAEIGRLTAAPGVRLTWPDGETTTALPGPVTGLGHA
ncbi:MSMEG_0567/sll0787 family protein [Amnibacterium kyonggiense]|uniref:Putative N-acetyltransferase (TIGR04045 family) n=1 Tax=Amnibacterium kyonggiense TaxID=595671 RepID=A0A4R7FGE3_9MICO|nr:MSMEG_0567/sll0787 family protein [Amnibacterium kyonggiense]TDS75677.1 putative N-acetyltransferase (TIGR04045 family) [Amnibacterium kyonggiense]